MADEEDDNKQAPIYEDEDQESGIFRWMSTLVVLLAIAGFFGLAWYAYRNGGDSVDEKDVEIIKADKTPVKEAPTNPGGMQIPNQDKTVYGLISGKPEKPVVERILPAPEEPMARSGGETETWMSDSLKSKTGTEEGAAKNSNATVANPSATTTDEAAPKEQFNPAKVRAESATNPPASPTPPAQVAAATVKAPVAPTPPVTVASNVTPATQQAPATVPAAPIKTPPAVPAKKTAPVADDADDSEDATETKPMTKTQAPPPGVRIQLGAYKSQSEAESNWTKIAHEFSDELKNKQHYIVRADLGDKGIFYRLQVAPFESSKDAEQFCIDFVSAGQGCIASKGK